MGKINRLLKALEDKYDPDNDTIPGAPMVTFADSCLLECIRTQQKMIDDLQTQIDELRKDITEIQ